MKTSTSADYGKQQKTTSTDLSFISII